LKIINSIIIDDEPNARENLKFLIEKYCKNIQILGEANSVETALELIQSLKPDVIFLDITLGTESGFDLLNRLENINFEIIFVTASDQFALNAIKFSALEYLLKPILVSDLLQAIQKLEKKLSQKVDTDFSVILDILKKPKNQDIRIVIPCMDGLEVIAISSILYCESDGEYTHIYLNNKTKIMSSYNIGEYESMFDDYSFFRIHHSYLVNKNYIKKYLKTDGSSVIMTNEKTLPISRRKKIDFLNWLKNNL